MKTKMLFISAMCLLAAVLLLVSPALAAEAEDEAAWEAQDAAFLQDLGILWGTGNGLELDQELTRAQAATLCVRLLGGEADALANPRPSPFADVPSWAEPYVGWLYTQGVTVGTGDTTWYSFFEGSAFDASPMDEVSLSAAEYELKLTAKILTTSVKTSTSESKRLDKFVFIKSSSLICFLYIY